MLREKRVLGLIFSLTVLVAVDAQAGFIKNLRYGLGAAGFQQQLIKDNLQDGWVLEFNQTFNDKHYDFGNSELTLLGGNMNGYFSIGHRGIPEVEFSINSTTIPYTFEYWDGLHKFTVDNGVFDIDSDIKINKYGFYDVQLNVVNRGTLVCDDPNIPPISLDYNVGPINVQGQWLVDLVNLTLGKAFGFVLPGGMSDQLAINPFAMSSSELTKSLKGIQQNLVQELGLDVTAPAGITITNVVPEPVSLLFLLTGLAGLMIRRRR